ncbi:MAG: carboxypeptidase-like regulatory domain-containing protein [Filimonas sp.]|nr:carboxypeptidase-like regulatory domain-containing protein [Filimonas sp.]
MKKYCCILIILFSLHNAYGQKISGKVTDDKGTVLPFASIVVKGSGLGTSANAEGEYSLALGKGHYILICQHVGYKTYEKELTLEQDLVNVNFHLEPQQYNLNEVVIKAGGEDPAYEIIRQAIKKRATHEKELKRFQCDVYIKGQFRLRNYPKHFLGQKVDFEDGDTSKKKILMLSETFAKYSVDVPDKVKVEVVSTKVSGNSNAFGFSYPQIISFYQNILQIGDALNPRGFISPISDNALNFYKYKFEGSFFENGKQISRIKVIPKRTYEPLFSGYINIIENEWRLYSVQLQLLREQQMQFIDTLNIEQLYVPLKNTWVIKQQNIYPAIKMFGFDAFGSFIQVYDNFNLNPHFEKKYFDNVVMQFDTAANKKTKGYWDTIRPIPLQQDELTDYRKKDSLEQARKDPHYLDSLDRARNKPNIVGLLLTGQTFSKEKKHQYITVPSAYEIINYNTVEGTVINISPTISRSWQGDGRRSLILSPNVRYGFSNHHFNAHLTGTYNFGKKYLNSFTFSGGQRVFQFNNAQPITPRDNSIVTLLRERNYMKIYQAVFAKASYSKGLGDGLTATGAVEFQDRSPLENTTNGTWKNYDDREFTPNYPTELTNSNIPRHQALSATVDLKWQPGAKYIVYPNRKVNIGSKYPTFHLSYTQGIYGVLGSDVDYSRWRATITDDINMQLGGRLDYKVAFGGFLNANKVYIPDYLHFNGNQLLFASTYLNSFQLAPYYQYSTTSGFYSTVNVEYHLNGLLSNKIPFFKKLNWFFVTGTNAFFVNKDNYYFEMFFSVENILKVIRVDFIQSFQPHGIGTSGIRIALPFISGTVEK